MAVESAADRAAFVNPDEFGVAATYVVAANGATVEIHGLFDEPADETFAAPGMMGGEVTFRCRVADLPAGSANGDQLSIPGTSPRSADLWRRRKAQPDGRGFVVLQLEMDDV